MHVCELITEHVCPILYPFCTLHFLLNDRSTRTYCVIRAYTTPSAHAKTPHQTYVRPPGSIVLSTKNLFPTHRSSSHSCWPAHLLCSAQHSPLSHIGLPLSMQYMHRAWQLSQRPSYTPAYTEPYSGAWDAHMQCCVHVCVIRGRGMRRL